jgi:hypothetical protein
MSTRRVNSKAQAKGPSKVGRATKIRDTLIAVATEDNIPEDFGEIPIELQRLRAIGLSIGPDAARAVIEEVEQGDLESVERNLGDLRRKVQNLKGENAKLKLELLDQLTEAIKAAKSLQGDQRTQAIAKIRELERLVCLN